MLFPVDGLSTALTSALKHHWDCPLCQKGLICSSFLSWKPFLIFTSISFRSQACCLILPTVPSINLQWFIIWVDESLRESQQRFLQKMLWNHLPASFSHLRPSYISWKCTISSSFYHDHSGCLYWSFDWLHP